jgi:class 3 adenylate cyclase
MHDERARQWWARLLRMSASPGAAAALSRMNYEIDIRHILPAIRVPTLILHATGDLTTNVGASRYMAERIPEAKLVELPSTDHLPWAADADAIVDEIEEFVTGERHVREPDRILATILFTDIVGSTDRAAAMGDQRWRDLLQGFYGRVRGEFRQYRGIEVGTAGDGVLARFDGPARAIRCAQSVANAVHALGIEVRTGLHTGECELIGDNVGGIAVHTAARVAALAQPAEVLVSHTVKDLVAGSGIRFEGRGTHTLKGVPGEWPLFAAVAQGAA